MIIWSRPSCAPPGTPFCAVSRVDASVHTFCRGRWVPSDGDEIRWSAPAEERCGGCVTAIEADCRMARELTERRAEIVAALLPPIPPDVQAAMRRHAHRLDTFVPFSGPVPDDEPEIDVTPGDADEPGAPT